MKNVGHLFVYRSDEQWRKESAAWALRRQNGVAWDEFDADELRQLEPACRATTSRACWSLRTATPSIRTGW